jgi:hypothetical protein
VNQEAGQIGAGQHQPLGRVIEQSPMALLADLTSSV